VEARPITVKDAIVDGKNLIRGWLASLAKVERAKIEARLEQLEDGNLGKHRNLAGGLVEIKFDSGHRIYAGRKGDVFILLLISGDKSGGKKRQNKDIAKSREIWEAYLENL
jgi:putative addiction module killer protein